MTNLQIMMMIHYYCTPEPYAMHEPCHANSEAVRDQRHYLQSERLLEASTDSKSGFRVTERGEAYVKALGDMPLPICKWIIPDAA